MSRNIPIALQAHLDTGATTICGILRIEPVRPGYSVIGLTDLDKDITYDDGDGAVTYLAPVGFTASAYVATADFTVDNAETKSLFPEFDIPQLTEADINAGAYDYATYRLMLINYEDTSQGHITLSTGTLGEMKTVDGTSRSGPTEEGPRTEAHAKSLCSTCVRKSPTRLLGQTRSSHRSSEPKPQSSMWTQRRFGL